MTIMSQIGSFSNCIFLQQFEKRTTIRRFIFFKYIIHGHKNILKTLFSMEWVFKYRSNLLQAITGYVFKVERSFKLITSAEPTKVFKPSQTADCAQKCLCLLRLNITTIVICRSPNGLFYISIIDLEFLSEWMCRAAHFRNKLPTGYF